MRRLFRSAFATTEDPPYLRPQSKAMLVVIPMLLWLFEMCIVLLHNGSAAIRGAPGVEYAMTHGTDAPNCSGPGGSINRTCPDAAGATLPEW